MNTKIILTSILLLIGVSVSAQKDTSVQPKKPVPHNVPKTDSIYNRKRDPMSKDSLITVPQKKKELSPMDTVLRSQPQH